MSSTLLRKNMEMARWSQQNRKTYHERVLAFKSTWSALSMLTLRALCPRPLPAISRGSSEE